MQDTHTLVFCNSGVYICHVSSRHSESTHAFVHLLAVACGYAHVTLSAMQSVVPVAWVAEIDLLDVDHQRSLQCCQISYWP